MVFTFREGGVNGFLLFFHTLLDGLHLLERYWMVFALDTFLFAITHDAETNKH